MYAWTDKQTDILYYYEQRNRVQNHCNEFMEIADRLLKLLPATYMQFMPVQ